MMKLLFSVIDKEGPLMAATIEFGDTDTSPATLSLKRANRHGFITGATGTGKTVTLQNIAQNMAAAGVPVFAVDVKGDLSGIALPKENGASLPPTFFWDVFGKQGEPIRTTVTEFGPLLFSRLLGLSDAQAGVLDIAFKLADTEGLLLIDLKDLNALLSNMSERTKEIGQQYGLASTQSIAAIQRELLRLDNDGGGVFFGEPALNLDDLMRVSSYGYGTVNVLAASELIQHTTLYATFLLWLLAELYQTLPEVGDLEKPKLCLFFDEAHLMFNDAPPVVIDKVEQVVRLIRSKGVGVYFCTQNPLDIPETVLAQLGNRFQHALRAYTPKEQKAVKVAATSFRPNPAFDTANTITELGIGEALVSTLDDKGVPTMVEKVKIRLPASRLGPISPAERGTIQQQSPLNGKYAEAIDRESAYERLTQKAQQAAAQQQTAKQAAGGAGGKAPSNMGDFVSSILIGNGRRQGVGEALVKSVIRSTGSSVGRQIGTQLVRGILGSLMR